MKKMTFKKSKALLVFLSGGLLALSSCTAATSTVFGFQISPSSNFQTDNEQQKLSLSGYNFNSFLTTQAPTSISGGNAFSNVFWSNLISPVYNFFTRLLQFSLRASDVNDVTSQKIVNTTSEEDKTLAKEFFYALSNELVGFDINQKIRFGIIGFETILNPNMQPTAASSSATTNGATTMTRMMASNQKSSLVINAINKHQGDNGTNSNNNSNNLLFPTTNSKLKVVDAMTKTASYESNVEISFSITLGYYNSASGSVATQRIGTSVVSEIVRTNNLWNGTLPTRETFTLTTSLKIKPTLTYSALEMTSFENKNKDDEVDLKDDLKEKAPSLVDFSTDIQDLDNTNLTSPKLFALNTRLASLNNDLNISNVLNKYASFFSFKKEQTSNIVNMTSSESSSSSK